MRLVYQGFQLIDMASLKALMQNFLNVFLEMNCNKKMEQQNSSTPTIGSSLTPSGMMNNFSNSENNQFSNVNNGSPQQQLNHTASLFSNLLGQTRTAANNPSEDENLNRQFATSANSLAQFYTMSIQSYRKSYNQGVKKSLLRITSFLLQYCNHNALSDGSCPPSIPIDVILGFMNQVLQEETLQPHPTTTSAQNSTSNNTQPLSNHSQNTSHVASQQSSLPNTTMDVGRDRVSSQQQQVTNNQDMIDVASPNNKMNTTTIVNTVDQNNHDTTLVNNATLPSTSSSNGQTPSCHQSNATLSNPFQFPFQFSGTSLLSSIIPQSGNAFDLTPPENYSFATSLLSGTVSSSTSSRTSRSHHRNYYSGPHSAENSQNKRTISDVVMTNCPNHSDDEDLEDIPALLFSTSSLSYGNQSSNPLTVNCASHNLSDLDISQEMSPLTQIFKKNRI